MKHVVVMSKNDHEVLLMWVKNIEHELQYLKPCYSVSEISHAVIVMKDILEREDK